MTALTSGLPASGVTAFVPWRSDDDERERLWSFCRRWWEAAGLDIRLGSSPPGPFNRAAAINAAAYGAWDVGVVIDADVLADPEQVARAVQHAQDSGRVTLAFDMYVGLNPAMTNRILEGWEGEWSRGAIRRSRVHESSVIAIPRQVFDRVGGFDERFVGWGQEDVAFIQSVRVLTGGVDRVSGEVYHLWHRPSRGRKSPDYRKNQELGVRYRAAQDPEAVLTLLAER